VSGSPIPVLTAQAREAQLIVVGDRGVGVASGALGSVAAALGIYAVCPVIVVRGEHGASVESRPIVVGVNGPSSDAAVAFAFEAAATRGVALVAVHAWWELLIDATVSSMAGRQAIGAAERDLLDERLAGWCAKYPQVRVQRVVQRDLPEHALVERSRAAQLVVVGGCARGWVPGLVLGSVSQTLLHRACCPVAVVRRRTGVAT